MNYIKDGNFYINGIPVKPNDMIYYIPQNKCYCEEMNFLSLTGDNDIAYISDEGMKGNIHLPNNKTARFIVLQQFYHNKQDAINVLLISKTRDILKNGIMNNILSDDKVLAISKILGVTL
jgi:hypothetical protein